MKQKFYAILASLFLVLAFNTNYAQDVVANGDFEAWTAGAPDDWTTIESGITLTEETTTVHGGSAACNVLVTTGTQGDTDFRQSVDVVAGTTYDVSLWVYQVDTTVSVRLYVGNYQNYSDASLQNEWQEMTYTYEATTTQTIEIGTRYYDQAGFDTQAEVIIDDFSMTAQVVTEPTVTITSPMEDDVIPSSDVTVEFVTQNFVIGTAGTGDGHLHYFVDGAMTMYYTSDPIELTGLAAGDHTVILQLVDDAHVALDPNVADTVNFSVTIPTEVATVADLRAGTIGEFYTLTGEAFVTYARSSRNQKYIQDATGGMLIDDNPGVITTTYVIGDGMTGVTGELSAFNEVLQFRPSEDPGAPSSTGNVTIPEVVTLADLNANQSDYESELILLEGISFDDAGSDFTYNTSFGVSQDAENGTFRTQFSEADYIGTPIPAMANVTALGSGFFGSAQFVARDLADIEVINPPANDNVCDAADIVVDGDAVTVDNTDATQDGDPASCWDTDVTGNVWLMFDFTPSDIANGVVISTIAGSSDDSQLALWTVTGCPDGPVEMTEIACNEDISGVNYMSTIASVLEAGTYYISCGTWGSGVGSFDVEVSSVLLPDNNSCSGAPITDVSVGTVATATGDGTNATASGGFPAAEVWEAFTLTECADLRIDFCGSSPQATSLYVNLFDACPIGTSLPIGTITTVGCAGSDSSLAITFTELAAGTYYYPVIADVAAADGFEAYTINYTATSCVVGVEEMEQADFSIYPNPNNGVFNVVNEGQAGEYLIEVIDVTGKVVFAEQVQLNGNAQTEINTSNINTGVYLVKMTNTDDNYYRTIRMIVK